MIGQGRGQKAAIAVRGDYTTVIAEKIVITTGTKPARPPEIDFDDNHVLDSDGVLRMQRIPRSLVVGGRA